MKQRQPIWVRWIGTLLVVCLLFTVLPQNALFAQSENEPARSAASEAVVSAAPAGVDWLEPQGISAIDLVGLVPEAHLRDVIVANTVPGGLLQYIEGSRNGDTVTIRVKVWPRFETYGWTRFNCLAVRGVSDHWAVGQPAGSVRIFDGERDITSKIRQFDYFYGGFVQPSYPADRLRYREKWYADLDFTDDGAFVLPVNMGCTLTLDGIWDSGNLTAVFTLVAPQVITVRTVGQQSFTFHSYIGPGYSGQVSSLQKQLERFGKRHDKFLLSIPAEADYVLVNYPAAPVCPYVVGDVARNIKTPCSGTYRLSRGETVLSNDHNFTVGLPLGAQWQDADQAGGRFLKRIEGINMWASLEYFIPVGVAYDPCMQNGGCSDDLLRRIVNAEMEATLYYYSVSRVSHGLVRMPLRQVGPDYEVAGVASMAVGSAEEVASVGLWPATATIPPARIYLPVVSQPVPVKQPPDDLPADNPDDCPCGWFTSDGRMVDVIPGLP